MQATIFKKFMIICMGIGSAGFRPSFINETGIVRPKKGTGRCIYDHVLIFVNPDVL